ncbi:monooxygenase [Leptodontidium sp. 2 PMI_412]|nr:monooxygenase [Leptodontidium sp. 2 PMI_412]
MNVIIIGAGPSAIAMAHTLKHKLGFQNFTIYEKLDGAGGTWRTNTYPGCGCDIPTHLYSFSFNLNPHWSKELCDQAEILQYMESTVDKFNLRKHMNFGIECLGARWNVRTQKWEVRLRDAANKEFVKEATIFISAVGGISEPRNIKFPGLEKFQGKTFHTARWDHTYHYQGKRMAIIGNGCSAAQVVPSVVKRVKTLTQYARSPQWYHERPNRTFTAVEKLCFRFVPFWQRLHRLQLFRTNDALVDTYMAGEKAKEKRAATEKTARDYIYRTAPKKYHDILVPDFPLGCKRRIFDPNYLESLHENNLTLLGEGIREFDATGITSETGEHQEFDVVVFATGFQVTNFLTPMHITGENGQSLADQWAADKGAQAYLGTYVHNFPNFAILFGPNSFPAHNSVIFASEVQVEYIAKTLVASLLNKRASVFDVKPEAENDFASGIDVLLKGTVYSADCSNWYINSEGRNSASWPGHAYGYWRATWFPRFKDFNLEGGSRTWVVRSATSSAFSAIFSKYSLMTVLATGMVWKGNFAKELVGW